MKLALLATTGLYPVEIGGPSSGAYFISKELSRHGVKVYLIARFKSYHKLASFLKSKAYEELIRGGVVFMPFVLKGYSPENFPDVVRAAHYITAMVKKLTGTRLDAVIYNAPPVDVSLLIPYVTKAKGVKQVFILHGGLFYEVRNPLGKLIMSLEKRFFDLIITPSEVAKGVALSFNFDEDKVVVIPNGVDLKRIEAVKPLNLTGHPRLLYVGRLAPIKDIPTLLLAFRVVKNKYPSAKLYIVGEGPERGKLERLAKRLGLADSVSFEGEVPTVKAYCYYKSCEVFVLPSLRESFGIALLEAMAAGIPVIASKAAVAHGLVRHEYNGLTFEVGNWKELASSLDYVLSDKEPVSYTHLTLPTTERV